MNRLESTGKQNMGLGGAMGLGGVGFQIEVTTPSAEGGGGQRPLEGAVGQEKGQQSRL